MDPLYQLISFSSVADKKLKIIYSRCCPLPRQLPTGVTDRQRAHPVVFATGCAKFNVVSTVVVDTSLGQHGIVLDLRFPGQSKGAKEMCESKQQIHHENKVNLTTDRTYKLTNASKRCRQAVIP